MAAGTEHNEGNIRIRLLDEIVSNKNILRDCTPRSALTLSPRLHAPKGELQVIFVSYDLETDTITYKEQGQFREKTIKNVSLYYNPKNPQKHG